MHKKKVIAVLVVAAVSAVGFIAFSGGTKIAPGPAAAAVDRGSVVETVSATGTVEAVSTVEVGTQVTGNIWKLYADFNSKVKKDEVVARLEPSLFQSRLTESRANLARAEASLERAKVAVEDARHKRDRARELSAQALLPQSELDASELAYQSAEAGLKDAEAAILQSRAAVEQAEVNLEHTVIRSPIDGVVIARNVDVGQTVAASLQAPTLFTIAEDLRKMQVVASVDEADVGMIAAGQKVEFRVDAFPEEAFEGTVSQVRLAPITVQNVVTYNTLVEVDNKDLKLFPGMTATVTFEVARHENALRVPNAALRYRPEAELVDVPAGTEPGAGRRRTSIVYQLEPDGKLRPVPVRVGLADDRYSEITQGRLEEGDLVAVGKSQEGGLAQGGPPSPMRFFGFGARRRQS